MRSTKNLVCATVVSSRPIAVAVCRPGPFDRLLMSSADPVRC